VRMKFRARRRPRAIDTKIEADHDLPTRRNGDVTGEKTGVSVDGLVLSDHAHVLVVPALAPIRPLDALHSNNSVWPGGLDFEQRVKSHGHYRWCVRVPFAVVDDELEGRSMFAVLLDDGPDLRRCVREDEEHVLLQLFRPLDDVSDLLGVLLLDKELLGEELEQAVFRYFL
jgi:hypothetical protein